MTPFTVQTNDNAANDEIETQLRTKSSENGDASDANNMSFVPENVNSIILPKEINMPDSMRKRLLDGSSLWDVVVEHHHHLNYHHDYRTTDLAVAQEVALDFFSSALVACPMTSQAINGPLIKKAHSIIQMWPNYLTASVQIRHAVTVTKDALFRHYDVTCDTPEADALPIKPRDVEHARLRIASDSVVRKWEILTGCYGNVFTEAEILKAMLKLFAWDEDGEKDAAVWREIFPHLFSQTELKKWIVEIFYHKKLVVDFYDVLKHEKGCVLGREIAVIHDNDKYCPYQLLGYTLKWYYGNEDTLFQPV